MTIDKWNQILFKDSITKEFNKGDVLYRSTDICNCIGRIIKGSVRVCRMLKSGKEVTIKQLNTGDYYAELIAFSKQCYPGWLIASEDCTVTEVKIDTVLKLLGEQDNLSFFLSNIALKVTKMTNNIELLSFKTIKQKIAYLITSSVDNIYKVTSISTLSTELGCSREALSRAISELVKDKVISNDSGLLKVKNQLLLEELFY